MNVSSFMQLLMNLLLFSFVAPRAAADAVITGSVFCDQCLDGQLGLFDYPLYGAKVAVTCTASDGQVMEYIEQTTSFVGNYGVRLEGSSGECFARVVMGPAGCNAGTGPPQRLKLMFKIFDTEFYTVDPLLSQPTEPMGFCPRSQAPPVSSYSPPPLPVASPPVTWQPPPAFACPHEAWTEPRHRCYWKVVCPDTKVVMAFGLIAAQQYGTDMTLWEGLQGRGDLYRTLLREATTSLLNSYSGSLFYYPTFMVFDYMNRALLGSPGDAMDIALRFRKANSGSPSSGGGACSLTPCS